MFYERTSVGLDVHARSIVGCGIDGETGEIIRTRLTPQPGAVLHWLAQLPGPVAVTYEAGPTGFGLARALAAAGIRCEVAAPSKLQRPSGNRVKTDANDALHLARLLRIGEVTSVRVPMLVEESARDLVRAREDVRGELMRARHRVSKLLLRHGIVYCEGRHAWTQQHHRWLAHQCFEQPTSQFALDMAVEQVLLAEARRDRLEKAISELAHDSQWTPVVIRMGCLRGISTLTAFALAVEIGDWERFTGASIGAYLGLVPSEDSSGARHHPGSITKAGNSHARRLLVEAAWHHRPPYRAPSAAMRKRWDVAPVAARARGHQGNLRLHQRWVGFNLRHKKGVTANVAIARELAGWCWSLAVMPD